MLNSEDVHTIIRLILMLFLNDCLAFRKEATSLIGREQADVLEDEDGQSMNTVTFLMRLLPSLSHIKCKVGGSALWLVEQRERRTL